jgi:dipeptidyl aminopeptidase/acylaminoacyl peptidase
VSPGGKEIAFLEHPVFDDDRGWVAVIDEAGNRKQLTKEFATVQGLAWSRRGKELWFTAADASTDRSLRGVTLSGSTREILVAPRSLRLLDIAADGRVLLASEELRSEIHAIDPATGKERDGLEWFNGSGLADISSDGKAILYSEWGGPAGELYLVVYRKTDGSAPTGLGEGTDPKLSPDGTIAAAPVLSRPPKLALHPIGTGESKRLELGEMVELTHLAWFPDGNHVLLLGAKSGEALRTYEMDLAGGKPATVGPAGFLGFAVANDGKRIFGRNGAGQAVVFDDETQNMKVAPGIGVQEQIQKWTEDGQALLTTTATPWDAEMHRVEVA